MSSMLRVVATLLVIGAAALLWFQGALTETPEALITWSTESEVDTAGFHVYRATVPEGPYEKVTERLITSAGDPFTGSSYEFRDPTVTSGTTYYYQLEELETTGNFNRLEDTVEYRATLAPNWILVSVLLVALLFIWLIPGR